MCGKTLREVGQALGVSEEAARKRVSRGVGRLREFFARRGVQMGAAAIPAAISGSTHAAVPAGLAGKVIASTSAGSIVGGSVSALLKGAIRMMFWTKAKIAGCVIAGVTLLGGTGAVLMTRAQPVPAQAPAANVAPSARPGATLTNGTVVQLLGVSGMPPSPWWSGDGAEIAPPCDSPQVDARSTQTHAFALSIVHPPGTDCAHVVAIEGVGGWNSSSASRGGEAIPGLTIFSVDAHRAR